MSKKVILFTVGLVTLVLISLCIAGPFGFFGRSSGGCANGVCNIPESEPTPTPVVVVPNEKPSNILLHVPKTQASVEVPKNELLTKPLCDCLTSGSKCICDSKKTCTCISCNCEACPIKTKPVVSSSTPIQKKEDVVDNGLDVNWAINQMKLGYKVKKKTFPEGVYFYMVGNIVYSNRATNPQLYFSQDDKDTNWENYVQESQNDYNTQYEYLPRRRGLFGRFR